MNSPPPALEMTHNVFVILRDLIHDRLGLHFDDWKRDVLADKISSLVQDRGFESFLDYYYLLKYGPENHDDWRAVMDALSVQETYFWREFAQVNALVENLLPKLIAESGSSTVRIWCAACATGEEPLTIAMALSEAGWFERASIEIHASDASSAAIAKAKRGVYRDRSFRALSEERRRKYFEVVQGGWQVCADLHARVRWSVANMMNLEEVAPLTKASFIFCRNVFIYFSDATIARTVVQFAKGMQRPGYLFIGAAESLLKITDVFQLQQAGDGFVYVLSPPASRD